MENKQIIKKLKNNGNVIKIKKYRLNNIKIKKNVKVVAKQPTRKKFKI